MRKVKEPINNPPLKPSDLKAGGDFKGLHIFYGRASIWGPCSALDCVDRSSDWVLSITAGINKYFNFCPSHEGLVLEKLLGSHLTRMKGSNPLKAGFNEPLVLRHPPDGLPPQDQGNPLDWE